MGHKISGPLRMLKTRSSRFSEGAWDFNPTDQPPRINRGSNPGHSSAHHRDSFITLLPRPILNLVWLGVLDMAKRKPRTTLLAHVKSPRTHSQGGESGFEPRYRYHPFDCLFMTLLAPAGRSSRRWPLSHLHVIALGCGPCKSGHTKR